MRSLHRNLRLRGSASSSPPLVSIGMQTADASPSCLLFDAGIVFWGEGDVGDGGHHSQLVDSFLVM